MSSLTVRVEGGVGRTTLQVDGDRPLADELPRLALLTGYAVAGAGWFAAKEDGTLLHSDTGLAAQGVADGATVRVAALVPATTPASTPPPAPSDDPPLQLLERPRPWRRVWNTTLVLLGMVELRGATGQGPISRARSAWRWADRRHRLEWMVAAPDLSRTVVIGVLSPGGGDMSVRLARDLHTVLTRHRREPVSFVDAVRSGSGPARHAIAEHMAGATPGIIVVHCGGPGSELVLHCDQLVAPPGHAPGTDGDPRLVIAEPFPESATASGAFIAESALDLAAELAGRWGRSRIPPADR